MSTVCTTQQLRSSLAMASYVPKAWRQLASGSVRAACGAISPPAVAVPRPGPAASRQRPPRLGIATCASARRRVVRCILYYSVCVRVAIGRPVCMIWRRGAACIISAQHVLQRPHQKSEQPSFQMDLSEWHFGGRDEAMSARQRSAKIDIGVWPGQLIYFSWWTLASLAGRRIDHIFY